MESVSTVFSPGAISETRSIRLCGPKRVGKESGERQCASSRAEGKNRLVCGG